MQTVLNVDDNPANRYIRSHALRGAGFEVIEAGTGQSALALARERHPSLLLLDIKLPDMSGLEVCRELRRDAWAQRIGIIHISATYLDIETESLNAGADIYLAEPVEQQELLSAVRTLVRLRRTEDRLVASEERMRLAMEAAGIAAWDIDLATGEGVWSDAFRGIMGFKGEAPAASLSAWLDCIVPEDRDAFRAAIERASSDGEPIRHEHWIERADNGERRCISVHGLLRRGDRGGGRLIGVALDVTERNRAEAEREELLRQARAQQRSAEEANRVKDEFLAILSHELRTPLTAMLGWIELVRSGRLSADQQAAGFDTIERNARLQIKLVNDLLDVSQIVAGKMRLDRVPIELEETLAAVIESQRLVAAAKPVALEVSMQPGVSVVRGSPERLEQVFGNLLANALKFTPRGGRVTVRLTRDAETVRVSVEDNGEGIPADALPHLFDRFWQVDSTDRRRHGGLGLGLAIVRSIVEMHGGTVEAESAGRGRGATFKVTLPLSVSDPGAEQPMPPPIERRSLSGLRILAVDDNADTLDVLALILRAEGAVVRCASDADAACAIAQTWKADVLVLDLAMPGEDGYSLLRRLRALHGSEVAPPAIAVTGYAGVEARDRAVASGFQAHLAKPFPVDELVAVIGQLADERQGA